MLIFNFLQIKNRFFFIYYSKLKKINMRKKIPKYFSYSKLENYYILIEFNIRGTLNINLFFFIFFN